MEPRKDVIVDALVEKLDARLRAWKPETAAEARQRIAEVVDLADHAVLDLSRSRAAEQQVLDLLDEPPFLDRPSR
jgi:exonuclease V gamma subunit